MTKKELRNLSAKILQASMSAFFSAPLLFGIEVRDRFTKKARKAIYTVLAPYLLDKEYIMPKQKGYAICLNIGVNGYLGNNGTFTMQKEKAHLWHYKRDTEKVAAAYIKRNFPARVIVVRTE